ncbi:hypothetical protein JCM10908_000525 [Rhodotorula pacifica]|uniref:uncharacterized protein n=1 Tax=Rhodotorula pacifica TaxID=1495444 RepID=UPI00317CC57D
MLKRGASVRSTKTPLVAPTATNSAATRSPPTDPVAPGEGVPRPTDVLVARLHEIKRLSKSLAAYYTTLGTAHEAHGKTLTSLAQGETLRLPWLEQDLFLPPVGAPPGEGGWAELVGQLKDGTGKEAEDHLELARITSTEIVEPLKQLRPTIKSYIADLEKHVNPLIHEVTKARENSFNSIQALTTAVGTYTNSPMTISAEHDPLIIRATTESQMREQVTKENELLAVVKQWQERTKAFEADIFAKIAAAVSLWEVESLKRFDTTRAHGRDITTRLDHLTPEVEWQHFASLNYLITDDAPTRNPDIVEYPERDHASTRPIKEGILERKKRVVKNWKEAYFVLSSAGFLHEYPDSTTSLASPSASLFLPNCVVTQVTNPEAGKDRHATFTISGRQSTASGSVRGTFGMQHSDVSRSYRARSYAEALEWWTEIDKLSKSPHGSDSGAVVAEERQGPVPIAVQRAGLPATTDEIPTSEVAPASQAQASSDAAAPALALAPAVATSAAVATSTPQQTVQPAATAASVPVSTHAGAAAASAAPFTTVVQSTQPVSSTAAPPTDGGSSFMRLNEATPVHASPGSAVGACSIPAASTTVATQPSTAAAPTPALHEKSAIAPAVSAAANGTTTTTSAVKPTTVEPSAPVMIDSDGIINKHLQKETKRPSWLHFSKKKQKPSRP